MGHGDTLKEGLDGLRVHAQREWIAAHGGDLLGYINNYVGMTLTLRDSDDIETTVKTLTQVIAIYYADLDYLRKLEGVSQDVIERDNAIRVLGEDYFA
jgi:hypothetical protein